MPFTFRPGQPSRRVRRISTPRPQKHRARLVRSGVSSSYQESPRWGSTTKLLVGITILAVIAALFASIKIVLGPLMFALVIAYLTYPLAAGLHRRLKINWRVLVSLLYLFIYAIVLGLLTWGGIALVEQVQSLIRFIESAIKDVPGLIQTWIATPPAIGPFVIDLQRLDIVTLANQALGIVQPLIGQAGSLVGTVASSAAAILGWAFFAFLIAYFIVSEMKAQPQNLLRFKVPGYTEDFRRIGRELGMIWNAFLRGQLAVFVLVSLVYLVILSLLGLRFFYGLAFLAGAARFIPYIGAWIFYAIIALVAYSQGYTLFGMEPGSYVLLVWISSVVTDAIIDNLISPRIFSNALKIHPAAVMVAAIVGFNVIGVAGVVLAAPVLATFLLFMDYLVAKMVDQDPWDSIQRVSSPRSIMTLLSRTLQVFSQWVKENARRSALWLQRRFRSAFSKQ